VKGSEIVCIIGPRLHKASKIKRFWGKARKDIEWVSRNNFGELRNNSRRRWGHIPSLRGRIGIRGSRRKSRGRVRYNIATVLSQVVVLYLPPVSVFFLPSHFYIGSVLTLHYATSMFSFIFFLC
jgi:hypothetical protein